MAWARLDDGFHDHPKVDGLSLAAVGLFTLCLTWAHRHRKTAVLQGHISDARVAKLAGRQARQLVAELIAANLWEPEDELGGWVIHDFADYLPKERDPEERRQAGKRGAANRWHRDSNRDGSTDGKLPSGEPSQVIAIDGSRASARAFPTRPVPESPSDSSSPRKRGTRIPEDWKPSSELVAAMRAEGIPDDLARRELPKFKDFWAAKSGRDATKVDWDATWRNWLRTAAERTGAVSSRPAVEKPKTHGGW